MQVELKTESDAFMCLKIAIDGKLSSRYPTWPKSRIEKTRQVLLLTAIKRYRNY
jgi:hypothetical protein